MQVKSVSRLYIMKVRAHWNILPSRNGYEPVGAFLANKDKGRRSFVTFEVSMKKWSEGPEFSLKYPHHYQIHIV
jgi:hypothetical protein